MASILNTDIFDLYDQWGQRVAFNEGYARQKIDEARQAGRDSASLGVDRTQAREHYFDTRDQRFVEAKEFLVGESAVQFSDSSDVDLVEVDQVGHVTDGEETLGMESVVANETEDQGSLYDEMMQDKFEETESIINDMSDDDWSRWHSMHVH